MIDWMFILMSACDGCEWLCLAIHRYLLGWTRPSKFSLLKGVRNSIFKKAWDPVLQDYMVKLEDLNEFINYSHENIECYPLWLCPVRHTIDVYPDEVRELVKDDLTTSIIVDVGIYGYANKTSNTIWV